MPFFAAFFIIQFPYACYNFTLSTGSEIRYSEIEAYFTVTPSLTSKSSDLPVRFKFSDVEVKLPV